MTDNIDIIDFAHDGRFEQAVRDFAASAEVPGDTRLTVHLYNDWAKVEATRWMSRLCGGCGQALLPETDLPEAETVYDQNGIATGSRNYQHGCGDFNPPAVSSRTVTDYGALDAALTAMLGELDQQVGEAGDEALGGIYAEAKRGIASATTELAGITDSLERADFLSAYSTDNPDNGDVSIRWNADRGEFYAILHTEHDADGYVTDIEEFYAD